MDQLLWYLLAGTRGGANRLRILILLSERPRNAHQIARDLGLDYRTVRHHLGILTRNGLLTCPFESRYGAPYLFGGQLLDHLPTLERIRSSLARNSGGILAKRFPTPLV
jgi:DNA-binding transcriptional ArsR family regulator